MASKAGSCVGPHKRQAETGLTWQFLFRMPRSDRLILLLGPLGDQAPSSVADLVWREGKYVAKTKDFCFSQLFFLKTVGLGMTMG